MKQMKAFVSLPQRREKVVGRTRAEKVVGQVRTGDGSVDRMRSSWRQPVAGSLSRPMG